MRPNAFFGPLGAACLLLAALAVPAAAWPAGRPETVVLDACGPLAVEPGLAEPWPGGRAARSGATVSPTDKGLGCRFTVAGKPAGAPVLVEARLTRPTPGGGQAVSRWFVPARRGEPAVAAYAFSPSDPAAPGLWTLELFAGDARLAGQAFTVPGAAGEVAAPATAESPAPAAAMPAAPTPAGPPAPGPEVPSQAVSAAPAALVPAPVPAMPPESRDPGPGPAAEAPTGREPAQDAAQASPAVSTETPAAAPVPEAALPRAGSPSPASPSAVPAVPADPAPAAMSPASVASPRPAADPAPTPKKAGVPPAAATSPKAPVVPEAPARHGQAAGSYALQTGLFADAANAAAQAARLRARGMPACLAVEGEGKARRYRVLAGRFGDARAAAGARADVRAIVGAAPLVMQLDAARLAGLRCH